MKVENFLDWLVELNVQHYKTVGNHNYAPTGNSHFYLKGSQERFTSKEMVDIYNNKATDELNVRWNDAIAEINQLK